MYITRYVGYKLNGLKFECNIKKYEPDDFKNIEDEKLLKKVNQENEKKEHKIIEMLSKKPFIRFECDAIWMEDEDAN